MASLDLPVSLSSSESVDVKSLNCVGGIAERDSDENLRWYSPSNCSSSSSSYKSLVQETVESGFNL